MTSRAMESTIVVMHVEDDAQLATDVAGLLRAQGFEALSAMDAATALGQVAQCERAPDVLIMDFNLPGEMDGADLTQEICRTLGHMVPTIFLSGELSNAALPWLPGMPLLFIAKPADPEVLLKAVESFAVLGRYILSRRRH